MQSSDHPMNLALNLVTADDVQIPLVDTRGDLPKREKHFNASVSGANFCCKSPTKPVGSPRVARGSVGSRLAADTYITTRRVSLSLGLGRIYFHCLELSFKMPFAWFCASKHFKWQVTFALYIRYNAWTRGDMD